MIFFIARIFPPIYVALLVHSWGLRGQQTKISFSFISLSISSFPSQPPDMGLGLCQRGKFSSACKSLLSQYKKIFPTLDQSPFGALLWCVLSLRSIPCVSFLFRFCSYAVPFDISQYDLHSIRSPLGQSMLNAAQPSSSHVLLGLPT